MASSRGTWREGLLAAPDREGYLLANSHLPGPRGNLELIDAAGDVLGLDEALGYALLAPEDTPPETGREFLPCCGIVAIGRLVSEGRDEVSLVAVLRAAANDPRWRVREAVAIALQRWGDIDLAAMHQVAASWVGGTLFEARAAVAAVCEPRLLRDRAAVDRATAILAGATRALVLTDRPRGEPGRVLGAALGYGWSVAIAADTSVALPPFERWVSTDDPDVRRMMRENLAKARFAKAAPDAVARLRAELG
jgi:hypothetical protein